MATNRNTPQHSVTLYPELAQLTERAEAIMGKPKSRLLYDACVRGLRESLRELEQNVVTIEYECSPTEAEYLQDLVTRSGLTQSEFIRTLISDYGETLVEAERATTTNEKRSRYKEMPCNWFHKPVEKSEFPNDNESPIISYSQVRAKAYDWAEEGQPLPRDMGEQGCNGRPIIHIFSNNGELTTLAHGSNGELLPLATYEEILSEGGYTLGCQAADEVWDIRVQEGVLHSAIEPSGIRWYPSWE